MSKRTVAATKLVDGDEVVDVTVIHEQATIILETENGYFLRFPVSEIPEKKKNAVGVRGMKLGRDDYVRNVYYLTEMETRIIEDGDSRIELSSLRIAGRDGKGVRAVKK